MDEEIDNTIICLKNYQPRDVLGNNGQKALPASPPTLSPPSFVTRCLSLMLLHNRDLLLSSSTGVVDIKVKLHSTLSAPNALLYIGSLDDKRMCEEGENFSQSRSDRFISWQSARAN